MDSNLFCKFITILIFLENWEDGIAPLSLWACNALSLDLDVWQEPKWKAVTYRLPTRFFVFLFLNFAKMSFLQIIIFPSH